MWTETDKAKIKVTRHKTRMRIHERIHNHKINQDKTSLKRRDNTNGCLKYAQNYTRIEVPKVDRRH